MKAKHLETHRSSNVAWLRASVLGANDGLISTASLLTGLASAGVSSQSLLLTGTAAMVAGGLSMAAGEYVSVSSQADTERADIRKERTELAKQPAHELQELAQIYESRGLTPDLAREVAQQLTKHDALGSHLRDELGLNELTLANPLQAAIASAIAFALGAATVVLLVYFWTGALASLPIAIALLSISVLAILGGCAAWLGKANVLIGASRVVFWGLLAMGGSALLGRVLGVHLT